jgi:16S rRNA (guanine527-N7)-methyltransferase
MNYAEQIREGSIALGHPLSKLAVHRLEIYLKVLQKWNERINLTSLTDPLQIIVYHFLDSLSAFSAFAPKAGMTIADLGSGGGFPGAVIQIVDPELKVTLVESSGKKVAFLHYLRGVLGLQQLEIKESRIEQLNRRFDLLMSRAISSSEILKVTPAILNPGGEIILFLKKSGVRSLQPFLRPYWVLHREIPIILPFVQERRFLAVIGKKESG